MENHPIPQDITGFEFKLIGDMTIKQFAYIAGGAIMGWVFYVLPISTFIKIPLALISVGIAAAFAFLPIGGRPMDLMIRHFLRAVFSPTQYVYQKAGGQLFAQPSTDLAPASKISEMSQKQFKDFLNALPKKGNKLDQKETVFFQSLNQYGASQPAQNIPRFVAEHAFAIGAANQPQPAMPPTQTPVDKAEEKKNVTPNEDLQKTAAALTKQLQEAKAKEAAQPAIGSKEYLDAHQKVLELQGNLNSLLLEKQQLETKLIDLQKKLGNQGQPVFSPSMAKPAVPSETKFVRSIPQAMQKSVGLPITPEFPNVITGIVKDPRGNPLPNILVEVKDEQGNAVRAFKTNALGQFASATPLINGNYTIEFEDSREQNKFDKVAFKAAGEIILPIEIISVDTREELRRSLFN
jgi:hypothetical protein